ncbi:recombinase family protein [Streptomyces yerevanensis]|uniref:recombinase family protein n=1 Tax=Streptomyces yerevanensis TaxID=66378 RepID=UPI0007C56549
MAAPTMIDVIVGEANRRDLSDPDDRFILRIDVAHACRSSDDTSRRLKEALKDKAREGNPHVGNRPYGYTRDGRAIVEEEAEIVREVYRRYLDGESPNHIAQDLAARSIPIQGPGNRWPPCCGPATRVPCDTGSHSLSDHVDRRID